MREQRKEARKRIKEWGKIVLPTECAVFNCTITDVSERGACLRVGEVRVPEAFFLLRKAKDVIFKAIVRNRRYGAVGVEFQSVATNEEAITVRGIIGQAKSAPLRGPPCRSDGRQVFQTFADTGQRRRSSDFAKVR